MGFFEEYFIGPIWDRTGYNSVNTVVYSLLALIAAYLIYRILKKENIKIDQAFVLSIIPFVLLGSTVRSLVDAADRGALSSHSDSFFGFLGFIYNTHIYDYGYLTVSPGIYVVIGLLTIASVLVANRLKRPMLAPAFGGILWAFHFILLFPMMNHITYGVFVIVLTAIAWAAGFLFFKKKGVRPFTSIVVAAHALDGAATYITIDIWNRFEPLCRNFGHCYGEQHVVSDAIGQIGNFLFGPGALFIGGFFLFYLVKVGFSAFAGYVVEKDSRGQERDFIILLLVIFGLAPGIRDLLTLVMGA